MKCYICDQDLDKPYNDPKTGVLAPCDKCQNVIDATIKEDIKRDQIESPLENILPTITPETWEYATEDEPISNLILPTETSLEEVE